MQTNSTTPIGELQIPVFIRNTALQFNAHAAHPIENAEITRARNALTTSDPDWALIGQPAPAPGSRQERETKQWMAAYDKFVELWPHRKDDFIANDHPLRDWVTRQRKHARNNQLLAWKRKLLDTISFPYQASRTAAVPTDLEYASQLTAFHATHGHYAPTITHGGAGLTHWVRRMRESGGKAGIKSAGAASAAEALLYLQEKMPGFTFDNTYKSDENESAGLTFNGFAPIERRRRKPSAELSMRVHGAIHFPVSLREFETAPVLLNEIVHRAKFYEQGLRVSMEPDSTENPWWLVSANSKTIVVAQSAPNGGGPVATRRIGVVAISAGGYNDDLGTFAVELTDTSGKCRTIDYDVCLSDLTHRRRHPEYFDCYIDSCLEKGAARVVDWAAWINGAGDRRRIVGPKSTANITFYKNLKMLRYHIQKEAQATSTIKPNPKPHISWRKSGFCYKFIEHELLRARQGNIPPSHVERLVAMKFTWGSQFETAVELLVQGQKSRSGVARRF